MPGLSGIEVIAKAKELSPDTDAVVLTGKSSLETAVAALRHGAFDYLTKPCKLVELEALLNRVAEKRELTNKYLALKRQLERLEGTPQLIGDSAAHGARPQADRQGRADQFDRADPRRNRHRQGTGRPGAARPKPAGRDAVRGDQLRRTAREPDRERTVRPSPRQLSPAPTSIASACSKWPTAARCFSTRSASCPRRMQAKLLRFLESGEIRRVGENESFIVDVRVVCATHRHLDEMVERRRLPRRPDVPHQHVRDPPAAAARADRRHSAAGPASAAALSPRRPAATTSCSRPTRCACSREHAWPGNVRELANVIEHATILCDAGPIARRAPAATSSNRAAVRTRRPRAASLKAVGSAPQTLREIEMQAIHQTLDRHGGNKPKAAEELGISLKTLYNKLNQSNGSLERSA